MCPYCKKTNSVCKSGTYTIASTQKKVQRYFCHECKKGFSSQTGTFDFRLRLRKINQSVFRLLSKGCSQRGTAQILSVAPQTIARRVIRFGIVSQAKLELELKLGPKIKEIMFDEMESFEHTKMKPLTIPIAVEKSTRKILALEVGRIPAKGPLAAKSRTKYGKRPCDRKKVLTSFFSKIQAMLTPSGQVISDESPHYPSFTSKFLPGHQHIRYKGGRGAIVGQGELKKQGFDPLFQLNHSYAMIRDNIKRLTRRTWCTTKRVDRLKYMLYIYANYHNQILTGILRPVIENINI